MTDLASLAPSEPLSRDRAFRAAVRHTKRVRAARLLMLFGALLGVVGIVGFAFFNPFRIAIPSVSIESLGLNGSKITMDKPKLEGFKSDGRPYSVTAVTAVQDARQPNVLELHGIDGHFTTADKSVVHIVSPLGNYDSSKETMTFKHEVRLTGDNGLDVKMKSAYVEFKAGMVDTREPLIVVLPSGTISADTMHMVDNGKQITFEGGVHSVMLPAAAVASAGASLKGTGP